MPVTRCIATLPGFSSNKDIAWCLTSVSLTKQLFVDRFAFLHVAARLDAREQKSGNLRSFTNTASRLLDFNQTSKRGNLPLVPAADVAKVETLQAAVTVPTCGDTRGKDRKDAWVPSAEWDKITSFEYNGKWKRRCLFYNCLMGSRFGDSCRRAHVVLNVEFFSNNKQIYLVWMPSRFTFLNVEAGTLMDCGEFLARFCCTQEWVHVGFLFSAKPAWKYWED